MKLIYNFQPISNILNYEHGMISKLGTSDWLIKTMTILAAIHVIRVSRVIRLNYLRQRSIVDIRHTYKVFVSIPITNNIRFYR